MNNCNQKELYLARSAPIKVISDSFLNSGIVNNDEVESGPKCKHGFAFGCPLCVVESAPKCKHGNVFYCIWCDNEKNPKCNHIGDERTCYFCVKTPECIHGNTLFCRYCDNPILYKFERSVKKK